MISCLRTAIGKEVLEERLESVLAMREHVISEGMGLVRRVLLAGLRAISPHPETDEMTDGGGHMDPVRPKPARILAGLEPVIESPIVS